MTVTVLTLLVAVAVTVALIVRATRPDPAFDVLVDELARRAAIQRIVEAGKQRTTLWEQRGTVDIGAPGRCIREMCYRQVDDTSDSFCTFHLTLLRKDV